MRHSLAPLLIGLAIFGSAFVSRAAEAPYARDIEPRFRAGLKDCERFDGATNEPACDGARVEVLIAGDDARLLRWGLGKSRFLISRDYYLAKGKLVFVVERVVLRHSGTDIADGLAITEWHQKQVLFRRIRPGGSSRLASASGAGPTEESWVEMEKHASELLELFRSHRGDFSRVGQR